MVNRFVVRLWKFEIGVTYNKALKQVIIWIGRRFFLNKKPIEIKTK